MQEYPKHIALDGIKEYMQGKKHLFTAWKGRAEK